MLEDSPQEVDVISREVKYRGRIWDIVRDVVALPDVVVTRDYLRHLGAVAVVALNEKNEVLVVKQYRHAVASEMVELPAGLLDIAEELPSQAAARELLEETGCTADQWNVLVDVCTTPGSSTETLRIFLARDITQQEWNASNLQAEEREIQRSWVALDEAVAAIQEGKWTNPTIVAGVLAAKLSNAQTLRPADSPWPMRERTLATERVFQF